jgi:hypothetical protein
MLTFDDVVTLAREFVRQKYPLLPPIGVVWHYHAGPTGEQLLFEMWMSSKPLVHMSPRADLPEFFHIEQPVAADSENADLARAGQWKVRFGTSWDTDDAGLPVHLELEIDEAGSVRQRPQPVRDDFDLED